MRPQNPIRAAALIVVAVIGFYIMWMGWRLSNILSSPEWCSKALQAERITPGNTFVGLTACVDLLKIQLKATATNSHIYALVVAFVLLVLVVIVIAGGKLRFKANAEGVEGDIGRDIPAPVAAQAVAESAQATADTITEVATP